MTYYDYERAVAENEAKDYQLDLLRTNLPRGIYPGYPQLSDRLFARLADLEYAPDECLILPPGPWEINEHPNRQDKDERPDLFESLGLLGLGLELDSRDRPLHPWLTDMIEDPAIGVVTGKGFYRKWGPNKTADPILVYRDSILLVKRNDTANWALPGGFIEPGDTPDEAAIRECQEETGIILPYDSDIEEVYNGLVVDIRVTANAWPETTAYLCTVNNDHELPEPRGSNENSKSAWFPIEAISREEVLFGAHKYLVRLALEALS
jgi:8-oxo-dGTP pyrophosphatase MutT (NUDIX family)